MANSFSYQVLKDDTETAVIKITGQFDGSGQEDNAVRIQANTLSGALATNGYLVANNQGGAANTTLSYYGVTIKRLWYDGWTSGGGVQMYWNAANQVPLIFMSGNGEYDGFGNWMSIPNLAKGTAGCKGDIGIKTTGAIANCTYTIIMELRKENEYYQRGQFNDPAAFNYAPYNLTP